MNSKLLLPKYTSISMAHSIVAANASWTIAIIYIEKHNAISIAYSTDAGGRSVTIVDVNEELTLDIPTTDLKL